MESKQEVKHCVLSGAGGFVGSHVLRHIMANTDWTVTCICSWRHKGTPERIKSALMDSSGKRLNMDYAKRTKVITHDLESPLPERTKNRIGEVDYILNIASNSHVDRSIDNPVPFVSGNVNLSLTMLELARELKPEVFLQFSTDEVYGPAPHGIDFEEWSPIIPSNPYSGSKGAQESVVTSWWRTYDVRVIMTNTMNVTGQTQDPEKFPAQLIRKIYNGDKVTIHGREGDIGSRHYIHARNVADALLFIINNLPPTMYQDGFINENPDPVFVRLYGEEIAKQIQVPDRYNIVGETELDNLEFAQMTANLMGKELKYELEDFHLTRPGHDRRYALSGKKLKDLGWQPPETFEESWKTTIDWTLEHKNWL